MKKRKAFTLVEILIAITFLATIIWLSSSMIVGSLKSQKVSYEDYDVQNSVRLATMYTNKIINESSAIFTIPEGRFREDNLTEGWDYYGLSDDKKEIVKYIYDKSLTGPLKHRKEVLVAEKPGITYDYTFRRSDNTDKKKYIKYIIQVLKDGISIDGARIETELEAKNSLQVVYRDTMTKRAVALAVRSDDRPGVNTVAIVTFVFDNSGSMDDKLNGRPTTNPDLRRMNMLKKATNSIIDEFAKMEDIVLMLVPFSTTANVPDPDDAASGEYHNFYDGESSEQIAQVHTLVNSMVSKGATNTGDGLRRAYYRNKYFQDTYVPLNYPRGTRTRHYMILLVDGDTNSSSVQYADFKHKKGHVYFDQAGPFNYLERRPGIASAPQYTCYSPTSIHPGGQKSVYNQKTYAESYRNIMSHKVKGLGIKSYIIGFNSTEETGVDDMAYDLGIEDKNIYKYNKPGFDLDLSIVFNEIKDDIVTDLWHIRGPAE